ncbi:MAG: WYL domain-containing protein [Oscillospiraceae bacterium]|nr:WYL domain-containing protein [Oscillospiraceae bacterium]
MIFNEIYGTYYNMLARLLSQAVDGELTEERLYATVQQEGYEESVLTVPKALKEQSWPLLKEDLTTPLRHKPTMPLTELQKRWLKALLQDPRIRLFDPPAVGLEEVAPLFAPDTFVYFDRYLDGDPFEDPHYIRRFRCILSAIREKRRLRIGFAGTHGREHLWNCVPYRLEYSSKDDKFRLISANKRGVLTINLSRITYCQPLGLCAGEDYRPRELSKRVLILELTDERNALERVMHHFSHFQRETERIGENRYRLRLTYERGDETELLIRVLSFGPVVQVVYPEDFIRDLKERLEKQKKLRARE